MLKLTFRVDVTRCARCITGIVSIVAFINDPDTVRKILSHLRLPTELPPVAPARIDPALDFDCVDEDSEDLPVWSGDEHYTSPVPQLGRGPP